MSARLRSFFLLCRCLDSDAAPAKLARLAEDVASPQVDWVEVLLTANGHFVAPALYGALRRKRLLDLMPDDAQLFLRDLHALNVARNEHLRRQVADLVRRLNGAGVEPIILKGAVSLFEPAFGDPGARMMGDLDILLPKAGFEHGLAAIREAGYGPREESDDPDEYALASHYRAGEVARVEIHRRLGQQQYLLGSDAAFGEAVALDVGGGRALALSPTHRVVHNIWHAHGQDHHHALGFISLKEHLDLVAICERHGPAIDWRRIDGLMRRHGLDRVLDSYLFTADHLLGLVVPRERRRPVAARLHYLRCLLGMRWEVLARATAKWVGLTYPFSRYYVDGFYGGSSGWLDVNVKRARYARRLFKKYGWRIFGVVRTRHDTFYRNPRTNIPFRGGVQQS